MDIKQLEYIKLIYEEKSISKAASKAGVVQPAISAQLRKLEAAIGLSLFVRTSQGVIATAAGEEVYQLAISVKKSIGQTEERLADLMEKELVTGSITVGLPPSVARGIFSDVFPKFSRLYPQVRVKLMEAYSGILTEWVKSGRVDLAIGAVPVKSSILKQRRLHTDQVVLISGEPIAGRQFTPCHLDKLPNLKLTLPSPGNSFGQTVRDLIATGEIVVANTVEIDGTSGALTLARSTDWACLCPFVAVHRDVRKHEMYIYPIKSPQLTWDLHLLFDERRPLSALASEFVRIVEEELRRIRAAWEELSDQFR